MEVSPLDEYNTLLLSNVHPDGWRNPEPAQRYNLVVMGAGTAGLVSAAAAAGLGARVALVERDLLGGDCLNAGCVPSKTLIRSSRACKDVPEAASLGIHASEARAVIDGEEEGFVKIHVREGTDKIVGATVVGRHAGEMISEIALAAEAIRKAADAYHGSRLTPFVQKRLALWLNWTR